MAHPIIDEILGHDLPKELLHQKHIDFLVAASKSEDYTIDFLKMSGIYWTITALDLLGGLSKLDKDEIVKFVISCHQPDGGFSPALNHDSHLISTLSAIQILSLFDSLDKVDHYVICKFISKLQVLLFLRFAIFK